MYQAEDLTGVYFGSEMERKDIETICLILQDKNPNIKCWKGKRSRTTFTIEFEEYPIA